MTDNSPTIAQPLVGEHMTQREYWQSVIDQAERDTAAHNAYVRQVELDSEYQIQAVRMQAQRAYLQIQADMWRALVPEIKASAGSQVQPIKATRASSSKHMLWVSAAIQFPLWWMLFYWLLTR